MMPQHRGGAARRLRAQRVPRRRLRVRWVLGARAAVDAAVVDLLEQEVVLEDVEHARHLREDEHAVAALGALGEQLVQQHQLRQP